MNLFAFLGIPGCAVHDCGMPGIVKVEIEGENGRFWANLCIGCMASVGPCLETLSKAAHEAAPLIGCSDRETL